MEFIVGALCRSLFEVVTEKLSRLHLSSNGAVKPQMPVTFAQMSSHFHQVK